MDLATAKRLLDGKGWVYNGKHTWERLALTVTLHVGEQDVWYFGCDESNMDSHDYGDVQVTINDVVLQFLPPGYVAEVCFVYDHTLVRSFIEDDEQLLAFINSNSLEADFDEDFTEIVRQEEDERINKADPEEDEYMKKLIESKEAPSRLRRLAISDVARLMIDNGWDHVEGNTWTKAVMDANYYMGEYGANDYDEVGFKAENVAITLKDDGTADLKFTYDGKEYTGFVDDHELGDLIEFDWFPNDVDDQFVSALDQNLAGGLVDAAEYMYVDR